MTPAVQQRLLELNRTFYAQVAADFDQTRAGLPVGWQPLVRYLPTSTVAQPITVLDAGCGNGRFARALEELGVHANYVGVDADAALLALAAENTADLGKTQVQFVQANLAEPGWAIQVRNLSLAYSTWGRGASKLHSHAEHGNEKWRGFDVVVCFAVLQHFPGYDLRLRVVKELAALIASGGVLIFSNWQFLTSARFIRKQIEWQTIGLTDAEVEPGDALLPWQQGGYAVRYVHQVDAQEMTMLAHEVGLHMVETFLADGKEGNLNLYAILR